MKYLTQTLLVLSLAHPPVSLAQTCHSDTTTAVNSDHYHLNNNGTATDNKTNLTWMRCALGQVWTNNACTGVPQLIQWQTALDKAQSMDFAGRHDWRIPTLEELRSIVEENCTDPAIDTITFPNVPPSSVYWSATPVTDFSTGAWVVNFYDSDDYWSYKYDYEAVRLVSSSPEQPQPKALPDCSSLDADKDGVNDCQDKCPDSMLGSKVNEFGCPISIELTGVQFALDSAVLTANSKGILDKVAQDLIHYAGEKKDIEVQGHTSSEASSAYNLKLSQRRAQSVVNYLKKQGVNDKLIAKGYGEEHPVVENATQAGRERNRRVELHWLGN